MFEKHVKADCSLSDRIWRLAGLGRRLRASLSPERVQDAQGQDDFTADRKEEGSLHDHYLESITSRVLLLTWDPVNSSLFGSLFVHESFVTPIS